MSSNKHYMNMQPITIYNLYKYMINLYKLGVIPSFSVNFNTDLNEIIFTICYDDIKWDKYGTSVISYNINTRKWKTRLNTLSLEELYNNYNYLIENNNVIFDKKFSDNNYLVLESYNIDDILEPSLNPFEPQYMNYGNYNLRDLVTVNSNHVHNINFSCYHMFINNVIKFETDIKFIKYKAQNDTIPEHLWNIIYENYKISYNSVNFNYFVNEYV
jgi:hypothetical protein